MADKGMIDRLGGHQDAVTQAMADDSSDVLAEAAEAVARAFAYDNRLRTSSELLKALTRINSQLPHLAQIKFFISLKKSLLNVVAKATQVKEDSLELEHVTSMLPP